MQFESSRIRLRPYRIEDLQIIHSWRSDPELRFMTMMHPFPVTLEQDRDWLMKRLNDFSSQSVSYAIELKETNILVGYIQLKEINLLHKHAFLGILIGSVEHRQKGMGKEAVLLITKFGFDMLGLRKISLEVLKNNSNAIKLYENLGFLKEGTFLKQFYFNGNSHDVLRMALFNNDVKKISG